MREGRRTDTSLHPRLNRELKTVKAMIAMYCEDKHGTRGHLCNRCHAVAEYAERRLRCCPFQADKPTCGTCLVHCYKPDMREQIQSVMRHSGPRMLLRHPLLALTHLFDEKLRKPKRLKSKQAQSHPTAHSGDNPQ